MSTTDVNSFIAVLSVSALLQKSGVRTVEESRVLRTDYRVPTVSSKLPESKSR